MKRRAAFILVACTGLAYADGHKSVGPENEKWKEECGSCHIAYPARLLTREDWQKLMGGLDKHFGANASLEPKERQEILDYLQRNAGTGERRSAASHRISDTPWFKREHREVSRRTWANPAVRSPANCTACHVNAERGDWSEHGIRMPGGQRREEGEDDDD